MSTKWLIFFSFLSLSSYAQKQENGIKELSKIMIQNTERNFLFGSEFWGDSCYFSQAFLMININNVSKISNIKISDNAPKWQKDEIERIRQKWKKEFAKLDSVAQKEKIKNCKVIFPLVIYSWAYPCTTSQSAFMFNQKYFSFDGELLKGNIIISDAIHLAIVSKPESKE